MKNFICSALLAMAGAGTANAQCMLVADKSTGNWGVGYNNDGQPTSYAQCKEVAQQSCYAQGGSDCVQVYQGIEQGWWAAISGVRANGELLVEFVKGKDSEYAAEMAVRKEYGAKGGLNAENVAAYGWYVHNNLK